MGTTEGGCAGGAADGGALRPGLVCVCEAGAGGGEVCVLSALRMSGSAAGQKDFFCSEREDRLIPGGTEGPDKDSTLTS